jgi:hypothetical protein
MALPKAGESVNGPSPMNDQAVLQAALPHNGPKHLARLLNISIETAKHYYYRKLAGYRRAEVALAVLREFDRETLQKLRERALVRRQLAEMAGLDHEVEILNEREKMGTARPFAVRVADWIDAQGDSLQDTARTLAEKASE